MTTTDAPGTHGATLRAVLDDLRAMDDHPRVRLALAEGEFRLATAPGTPADEAVMLLRSAVTRDPFLAKGHLHLGRLLHRRGRHRAAVAEYLAGLDVTPGSRRMHLLLAEALLELDRAGQAAGAELIRALAGPDPERVRAAVAAASALLAGDGTDGAAEGPEATGSTEDDGKGSTPRRRRARPRPSSEVPDLGDMWLVWLLGELSRGAKPAQVDAVLKAGAADPARTGGTELAVGCALAVLSGHPADRVPDVAVPGPAGDALAAVLDLARAPDGQAFRDVAGRVAADGSLPAVAVAVLHHRRFGPGSTPLVEALRAVDAYPHGLRGDDGFRELRIAFLDHDAAAAWQADEIARARLLWREVLVLDPVRIPAAVNLALLAARENAAEDYGSAWERLFELLYLLPAGVGDVQYLLAERRDLHLALVRQSLLRHCPSTPPGGTPGGTELADWVRDQDAVTVWLRDWDGWYVNARLSFRSPLHLLGVPRDVSEAGLAEARDSLNRHVEAVLADRARAGTAAFRRLAADGVEDAYARTVEPVDRARDPYAEFERERADELAGEIVHRLLMLRLLLVALAGQPPTTARAELAAAIVRHQALLPQPVLAALIVERGVVDSGTGPADIVEDAVVGLAQRWSQRQPDPATFAACLDAIVGALPGSPILRVLHARALYAADRPADAYATAMTALTSPGTADDDRADEIRDALVSVIDRIGRDEIPDMRRAGTVADFTAIAGRMEASLRRYPAGTALRAALAELHLQLDRVESNAVRQQQAADLLVRGIVEALDDRHSGRFTDLLATIATYSVETAVRAVAGELLAGPPDAAAVDVAVPLADRITRCRDLAREHGPAGTAADLERALTRHRTQDPVGR